MNRLAPNPSPSRCEANPEPLIRSQAQLGLSKDELTKAIKTCPQLLGPSDLITTRINKLVELLDLNHVDPAAKVATLRKVAVRFPQVLLLDPEKNLAPSFEQLRRIIGLSHERTVRMIARHPQVRGAWHVEIHACVSCDKSQRI